MAHHRDDAWGQLDQSHPFLPARRRAGKKIGGDGVDGEVAMTGRHCTRTKHINTSFFGVIGHPVEHLLERLPRELSLDHAGRLLQSPARELEGLRRDHDGAPGRPAGCGCSSTARSWRSSSTAARRSPRECRPSRPTRRSRSCQLETTGRSPSSGSTSIRSRRSGESRTAW